MFAILVTSIGLLGAVAILPVASSNAKKGQINDSLLGAGRTAISRYDARGMRIPGRQAAPNVNGLVFPQLVAFDNWIAFEARINELPGINFDPTPDANVDPVVAAIGKRQIDGHARYPWTEQLYYQSTINDGTPAHVIGRNWFNGIDSFCIDPRLIAANYDLTNEAANNSRKLITDHERAGRFPVNPADFTSPSPLIPFPYMWRISLSDSTRQAPLFERPLLPAMANAIFMLDDDLVFNRPDDRSLPAQLPFDLTLPGSNASKRQSDGHFSWMATLVPEFNGTSLGYSDLYTLSIVMFHDRPTGLDVTDTQQFVLNERIVSVEAHGGGVGGGEFKLAVSNITDTSGKNVVASGNDLLNLHPNDWVCLSATAFHKVNQATGNPIPVPVFKWYRVSDCEPEATEVPVADSGNWEQYVTLVGQDWPFPATMTISGSTVPVTRAIIVQGVVGVYEKSVRLEYSED